MESDPYAPPANVPDAADQKPALREIVLSWERLRLIYNGLLAVPGTLLLLELTREQELPLPAAILSGGLVAAGANACFFLGPLAELYLRGLLRGGQPLGRGRWLIFGAGLVFSLGVLLVAYVLVAVAGD